MSLASSKLALLNSYRTGEGKEPFKDWRNARHQPMLDAYEQAQADREYAERKAQLEAAQAAQRAAEAEMEANASKGEKAKPAETKPTKAPKVEKVKGATGDKAPSYKAIANYEKSSVESPVAYIHAFLDANPDMGRKAAVVELVGRGINYSTARTQYQRWSSKRKAGA